MKGNRILFSLIAILAVLVIAIPASATTWAPVYTTQKHLDPTTISQFKSQLPILSVAGGSIETIVADNSQINLAMKEFKARMLPGDFVPSGGDVSYTGTYAWGYVNTSPNAAIPFVQGASRDTYTGPVVVATRGIPTQMKFVNDLGTTASTQVLAYKLSTDQSLHWANPSGVMKYVSNPGGDPAWLGNPDHYAGAIPAAVHLHGAEDPAAIDGGPDSWFTSAGQHGPAYYSMDGNTSGNYTIYRYPNVQEAAPLWFHDHTLGATRLNVYAGLAGGYDLIDPKLKLPTGLSPIGLTRTIGANGGDDTIIPLVVQDRMFDTNGQLLYNTSPFPVEDALNSATNPQHPYWTPEFFGDTIAVNGKVWPNLDVKAQRYRFYMINGSNARSYILSFDDTSIGTTPIVTNAAHPTIWQVATDQGYLDNPVAVSQLVLMPGERADFILDFSGISAGTKLVLTNVGPDVPMNTLPVEPSEVADPVTTGKVMQFTVGASTPAPDTSFNPAAPGATIRTDGQKIVRLVDPNNGTLAKGVKPDLTRSLVLKEIANDNPSSVNGLDFGGGPLEVLVNNTKYMGTRSDDADPNMMGAPVNGGKNDGLGNYLTERPNEGDTEVWEIVNLTADSHPIHTHLAQFQLMNRQQFSGDMDTETGGYYDAYAGAFPGGTFIPAYGSPLAYTPSKASGGKYGGNPDVTPYLDGPAVGPNPNEAGWKDTVMCPPGTVTRFVVRWAPTDDRVMNNGNASLRYAFVPNGPVQGKPKATYDYVWHCHIVDHEDNEMMRPDTIVSKVPEAARPYKMGRDY